MYISLKENTFYSILTTMLAVPHHFHADPVSAFHVDAYILYSIVIYTSYVHDPAVYHQTGAFLPSRICLIQC